jgi:hypothetical protein
MAAKRSNPCSVENNAMLEILRQTLWDRGLRVNALVAGTFCLGLRTYLMWLTPGTTPAFMDMPIALAIAGMIGPDVVDGSLHILLTRPISRNGYLAGRALGSLVVGLAWLALSGAVMWGLQVVQGESKDLEKILLLHVNLALFVLWGWALLFLASCVLPGYLDIAGMVALFFAGRSLGQLAFSQQPWLARFGEFASENLVNDFHIYELNLAGVVASDAVRYFSKIAIALLLGALIFNRREFSYGTD